jgi:arsenate reductase (thioredoxin)
MTSKPYYVLFLCTHNTARSIIAQAVLNHLDPDRFIAFSAGSHPSPDGRVHPYALAALSDQGIPIEGLSSKSWLVFGNPRAPVMDLVITVCDATGMETCPQWPGQPGTAHWGYPDPVSMFATEEARMEAFQVAVQVFSRRLTVFAQLADERLDTYRLEQRARSVAATWSQPNANVKLGSC